VETGRRAARGTLALGAVLAAALGQAAVEVGPRPDRYATDRAGVVGATRLSALNERLAQFERETSTQVLVFVDRRLPPNTTIEEYAEAAFEAWGVGQKGKDNGAVFFVFVDDRQMRIEVGYGLEGALPDIRAASIIEDHAKPRFRANDFAGGVDAAADQVMRAARGEPYQGSGRTHAEGGGTADGPPPFWMWLVPLGAITLAALVARTGETASQRWTRGAVTAAIATALGTMGATVASQDGRMLALGFGFLLLGGAPALWFGAERHADRSLSARRALGRRIMVVAGCVIAVCAGLLCFLTIFGLRLGAGGYVLLAAVLALPVGGVLFSRDPMETLTFAANRLSGMVFFPSLLFAAFFFIFGATEQLPALLDWMVPSGLVLLVSIVVARSRGWVLWPKSGGGGGSYSGSGYSPGGSRSSGSGYSSSSSSSGSSFSGGGGSSGGGGASGSW
jgi:uncharacterized protein